MRDYNAGPDRMALWKGRDWIENLVCLHRQHLPEPHGEGIFRKMMVERGMEERVLCQSAGLSAVDGMPVSENAVAACRESRGGYLRAHRPADYREELPVWDLYFPHVQDPRLHSGPGGVPQTKIYIPKYIADPYGGDLEEYRACRDKLCQQLETLREDFCHPAAGV